MLKPKSRSLIVTEPSYDALKDHIETLVQKSEEMVKEKIMRQQQKQARVELIEHQFVEWAARKENAFKEKMQKSNKNKGEYIFKIVKKCKDHDKYLGEKLKNYQNKKRASMKQAWKKAQQFSQDIQQHNYSKQLSKEKSISKTVPENQMANSQFIHKRVIPQQHLEYQREYLSLSNVNPSKKMNNLSREYLAELNQSIKQFKHSETMPTYQESKIDEDEKNRLASETKFKQTFARFRQNIQKQQQIKIQQLGQRLEKIQKSRNKKHQLFYKKKQKEENLQTSHNERREKKKPNRTERVHSQNMMRQNRVVDRSEENRKKREEFFQNQLQSGTEYLQSHKIKFLKTTLAKRINISAIEKKLYFQRLTH